ncbi:MAG: hypothetical protein LBL40_00855 [Coxiellaceae bacterium]|jgi:hypothetical protein|nr:hypothetical protein [Coxiellaceae bacterium]
MHIKIRYVIITTSLLLTWQSLAFGATGIYTTIASGWTSVAGLPAINFGTGYLHDFNKIFGIGFETCYLNTGKRTNIKTTAIEFLFIAAIHDNFIKPEKLDLAMKIGGSRSSTKIDDYKNNRIQPVIGVDVCYNFTPHLAALIKYAHYFNNGCHSIENQKCQSINTATWGIRITFW